jgi:hypothetical protein
MRYEQWNLYGAAVTSPPRLGRIRPVDIWEPGDTINWRPLWLFLAVDALFSLAFALCVAALS